MKYIVLFTKLMNKRRKKLNFNRKKQLKYSRTQHFIQHRIRKRWYWIQITSNVCFSQMNQLQQVEDLIAFCRPRSHYKSLSPLAFKELIIHFILIISAYNYARLQVFCLYFVVQIISCTIMMARFAIVGNLKLLDFSSA